MFKRLLAAAAAIAAVASGPAFAGKTDNTVRFAYDQVIENVDPYFNNVRLGVILGANVWDTLVYRDPETKALPAVAAALILTGTIFYWRFEDWTIIESLYFCVVTLATVGFGDFTPTTPGTQIFTVVYILTGFGILAALLTSVAHQYLQQKAESPSGRERRRARRQGRAGEGSDKTPS